MDEIWDFIESVSGGFPTYFYNSVPLLQTSLLIREIKNMNDIIMNIRTCKIVSRERFTVYNLDDIMQNGNYRLFIARPTSVRHSCPSYYSRLYSVNLDQLSLDII